MALVKGEYQRLASPERQAALCFDLRRKMATVAINVVLRDTRLLAGEELYAKILVDTAEISTFVNDFYAEVEGTAHTGWINIHTDKIFETGKQYLNAHIPLLASGSCLQEGRHQFPIRILIPEHVPSSYESQFGTVRYTIKVVLKTNSEQSSVTEVFPFLVVARSFLNELPQKMLRNLEYSDEVDFTCCTVPFGRVSVKVAMPRAGFVIGEAIPCSIYVKNGMRKTLKQCCLCVVMKTQFEAMSRYERLNEKKLSEQVIESVELGKAKARGQTSFEDRVLKLPESAPPTQYYDKHSADPNIIALSYVAKFTANPGIEMEIPIVIVAKAHKESLQMSQKRKMQQFNDPEMIYL